MASQRGSSAKRRQPAGRLRIVAGKWRGRVLRVVDLPGLRPTSERIRETLFNWLAPEIQGARCLDLYAGTGALGLEALSRGAASACFVENAKPAVRALRDAVRLLDAQEASVRSGDAREFLDSAPPEGYDIVFLDPPYADDSVGELCRLLASGGWVSHGSLVYFEQDRRQAPPDMPDGWVLEKRKTAGQVCYSLASVG